MADRLTTRGVLSAPSARAPSQACAATVTVALDCAYYNPLSLVVRDQRLVEAARR